MPEVQLAAERHMRPSNAVAISSNSIPALKSRIAWLVFTVLACGHFTLAYIWRGHYFLNLPLYARGGERLPYQGRVLMAWVLRSTAGDPRIGAKLTHLGTHLPIQFRDPYTLVLLAVCFVSIFIAVLATRASLLHLTGDRRVASWAALLTVYMAFFNLVQVYGLTYTLPYDVPSLALFSVAVWLVLTGRYWLLLPVFIVGTLNRETFCFITVFLALYTWFGLSRSDAQPNPLAAWLRKIAPHLVLQAIFWVAIRLWLRHQFLHNPYDTAEGNGLFAVHLAKNIKSFLNPQQWPLFLSLFGFTLPLFFGGYRRISDRALAKSTAILFGLWFCAMMLVGVIVEVRVFDELTAFLAPCVALILWNRWIVPARQSLQAD